MTEFVTVARTREIAPGTSRQCRVNGRRVAVFNVDGAFHACDDECPHVGLSLAAGDIEDGKVVCYGHGWGFDLTTGECDRMPVDVDVFPVEVVNGEVRVRVDDD